MLSPHDTQGRRPKVGLYGTSPIIGGAELYLKDLLWRLDRDVFDVTLFYLRWPQFDRFLGIDNLEKTTVIPLSIRECEAPWQTDRPVRGGLVAATLAKVKRSLPGLVQRAVTKAVWLSARYFYLPYNFLVLYFTFRRNPVDVLHINNGGYPGATGAQVAAIAAKLAGVKRCIMIVANTPYPVKFPKAPERLLDRLVLKAMDQFIVMSPTLGDYLVERRGVNPAKISVIPYGALEPTVNKSGRDSRSTASRNIVMVAQFLEHKGHSHLLHALARLSDLTPSVTLTFIGDGPYRPAVEHLTHKLGLSDQVEFAGYRTQDEVFQFIQRSDLFVLPSDLEGLPYAILHAMSLGKPVVASRVGGIGDCVLDGVTGLLVQPNDVAELDAAIRKLLLDPGYARRLGRAGRERYSEHYTLARMIANYESLYRELAASA